jgi:predicted amidohydrolase YtcJ
MKMVLKYNFCFAALLIALTTSCQPRTNSTDEEIPDSVIEKADLVIENAKIFTANKQQPWAEALAVKNGKFIYVGDASGIASYQSATTIDLKGKLLIPGMVDGHSHPGYVNVENFGKVEGGTAAELLASVKKYADEHPDDEWLRLCCWPTDMFVEGNQGPKKEVLNAVLPDRLVWFESATAHDFCLNSKAL